MPTNTTPPRRRGRALAAAAAALLLTLAGLTVAAPASAHDELISSSPAADATLEALAGPARPHVQRRARHGCGCDRASGDGCRRHVARRAAIRWSTGTIVTQALTGAASGVVTVLWKVVSSDGHPISGQYTFTVTAPPTPTPTATPTATAHDVAHRDADRGADAHTHRDADAGRRHRRGRAVDPPRRPRASPSVGAVTYLLVSRSRRQKALEQGAADAAAAGSASPADPHSPPPADR